MDAREHAALALRRLGVKLCLLTLVVLALVGGAVVLAIGVSWLVPQRLAERCLPVSGDLPIDPLGPSGLNSEQRANAAVIVAVGRARRVPDRGLWIALATAMQESRLRNLDYGDRDSLGLFQQRPSQGWGSPAQVKDPRYAADQFFTRLSAIPDWAEQPLWAAAQAVQRSAFPLAYARWEQQAADLLAEVDTAGASPGAAGTQVTAPACDGRPVPALPAAEGGPRSRPPGCTADDPTTRGCVTATTRDALDQAVATFGGLRRGRLIDSTTCFADRPANPTSDHPQGKGCDMFPGPGGAFATGPDVDDGWVIAEWFRTNAAALDVAYIIWQGQIWTRPDSDPAQARWADYTGGGVYDPTDAVGGHYDHIHVSFRR